MYLLYKVVTMVTILWQNLKKPKPENDTGVIMEDDEDDEITGNDEVNSSLVEGAVTRALYGDEQGIVCVSCWVATVIHLVFHSIN